MSEPRLVVVTWQDPQQETGVPGTKPPKLYTWRTTGWLIDEDHDGLLVIATSLGEDGDVDRVTIPRSLVMSIERLEIQRAPAVRRIHTA